MSTHTPRPWVAHVRLYTRTISADNVQIPVYVVIVRHEECALCRATTPADTRETR